MIQGRSDSTIFCTSCARFRKSRGKRTASNAWHKPVRIDIVFKPGDVRNLNVFFSNFAHTGKKITRNLLSSISGKKMKERKRKKKKKIHQKTTRKEMWLVQFWKTVVLCFHRFEIGRSTLHEQKFCSTASTKQVQLLLTTNHRSQHACCI